MPTPPSVATRTRALPRLGARSASPGLMSTVTPTVPQHRMLDRSSEATTAINKDRTVSSGTIDTTSTATPPNMLDSPPGIEEKSDCDDFAHLFNRVNVQSNGSQSQSRESPPPSDCLHDTDQIASPPHLSSYRQRRKPAAVSLSLSQTQGQYSSPYSAASTGSQEYLPRTPSPSKTFTSRSPLNFDMRYAMNQPQNHSATRHVNSRLDMSPEDRPEPLRLNPVKRKAPPSSFPRQASKQTEHGRQHNESAVDVDPILAENAVLVSRYEDLKPKPPEANRLGKVMTPAQFEQYRAEQEMARKLKGDTSDSDEDKERYGDDDEIDRDRKATKQRRKQQAQLAVYRQSMMKMTGERSDPHPRSLSNFSHSESVVSGSSRLSGLQPGENGDEEEEEDEDVPLGVLAAHGFPYKNRPPTRLSTSTSSSHLCANGSPASAPPGGSVTGDAGSRGTLPPFARNLPRDPYPREGLVNASKRHSFALGGGSSVTGVPAGTSPGTYAPHPSGLVGVIAEEERSRAFRRGSATAPGSYNSPVPGLSNSQSMLNLPSGLLPGMLSPGDQAQVQMSQQMNQMMQMQWQWMQQMQVQMSQLHGAQQGRVTPDQNSGIPGNMGNCNTPSPSPPNLMFNGMPGYAPSIAPSERNNVGLASRYRPVSFNANAATAWNSFTTSSDTGHRPSTLTGSTPRPWSSYGMNTTGMMNRARSPTGATIRTVNPTAKHGGQVGFRSVEDEEDEEGWEEMKRERDRKKQAWAAKREGRRDNEKELDELRGMVPHGLRSNI